MGRRTGVTYKQKERKGHITTYGRRHLAEGDFALPPGDDEKAAGMKGRYPIDTVSRARNALARVAQNGSPEEQEEVRRRVHEKHPDILIDRRRVR